MYKFPQNSPKFSKFPRNSRQSLLKAKNSPKLKIVLDNLLKLWYTGQGVKNIVYLLLQVGAEKINQSVPRGTIGKKKSAQAR